MEKANRHFEIEKFKLFLLGSSRDYKTNHWRVTCKSCGKYHEPPTTMLKDQTLECRCGAKEVVDYNSLN